MQTTTWECFPVSRCISWWLFVVQRVEAGAHLRRVSLYLRQANAARCQVEEEDEAIHRVTIPSHDNTKWHSCLRVCNNQEREGYVGSSKEAT